MPPPPAEPFATRVLLGPALRTQSDRRLVTLVRQGYETAFEEIVRRYRRPLDRFAAAIVGGRSEDVTQDAFSKALLALRGSEAEIELRPWLYRIVRNTALNDLRDRPPSAEQLKETIPGGLSAAAEAERREEMAELTERLRALPETQRAAIVMRELEGLSHEEIAAALGVSGGAARQAIHRARVALRDGLGLLIPLPLLRMLFDHSAEAAGGAAAAAGAGAASAMGGGAAAGGLGAGGAVKAGLAAALIGGAVGTGVAVQNGHNDNGAANAAQVPVAESRSSEGSTTEDSSGHSGGSESDDRGSDSDDSSGHGGDDSGQHGSDRGEREGRDDRSGSSGHGGLDDNSGPSGEDPGSSSSESGSSGSSHSGSDGVEDSSGSSGSGSGGEDDFSGSSGSDDLDSGSSGSGATTPAAAETTSYLASSQSLPMPMSTSSAGSSS